MSATNNGFHFCAKKIMSKPTQLPDAKPIFVGYPYAFDKTSYRRVYTGLQRRLGVKFLFADQEISNVHILQKITSMIDDSLFCIFDVTTWNPNVSLEYGIAVGLQKKAYIVFNPTYDDKAHVPADIAGFDRIDYNDYEMLKAGLLKCVYGEVRKSRENFSASSELEKDILLALFRAGEPLGRSHVAEMVNADKELISLTLQQMRDSGKVRQVGAKRGTKYEPVVDFRDSTAA